MSLRSVHLLFIVLSTLLAAFLGWWAIDQYVSRGVTSDGVIAVISIVTTVVLTAYGIAFSRKSVNW